MTEAEAAALAARATRPWFDPAGKHWLGVERWEGSLEDWFVQHWQRHPGTRPRNLTAAVIEPPTLHMDPPSSTRGSWKWSGDTWS